MCLAFPGRVVELDGAGAVVESDGRRRRAATFLLPAVQVGDWVTVSAGTILGRLEPAEAEDLMTLIRTATTGRPSNPGHAGAAATDGSPS
jgi:hydrogenase assembly chaperone HypC/HupF